MTTKERFEKEFAVKDDQLGKGKYSVPTHYPATRIIAFIDQEIRMAEEAERESGEEGEGLWMGKKIKDMTRLEIIKAWKVTDSLYRDLLSQDK